MSQFPINVTALPINITPINVTPKTEFNHKCHSSEHRERVDTSSLSFFSSKFRKLTQNPRTSLKLIGNRRKLSKHLQKSLKDLLISPKIVITLQKLPETL